MPHSVDFALLAIIIPCLVGSVMYGALGLWDRLLRRGRPDRKGLPDVDYLI